MSSKKFIYLLVMAAIVCGLIAGDTAYGQDKAANLLFKGTVQNPDGTPAAGHTVAGEIVGASVLPIGPSTTGPDGSYQYSFISLGNEITAGDVVTLTVSDSAQNVVGVASYTVVAADLPPPSIVELDIALPAPKSLTVKVDPIELPADGTSTSEITITVRDGGEGVTGDTISVSTDNGTVGATATEVGNGVYTATYTAPPTLPFIPIAQINVSSATTDQSTSTVILLKPVPTTVTVDVSPSSFIADTPGTGAVTITVERVGPVTGETVTLALSPAVGSVSAVTNNGDGSYSATYTSGGTAGNVTLTATATGAAVSSTANIVINAGPPAAIALSAAPMTVTSLGSATVTAMVTDSGGNGVGGLSLTGSTSGSGTLTPFIPTPVFGTYVATYSAPMVEAEGTETITVSTDGISADLTLDLTPEPPIDVNIITIEGTVYKEDGDVPADGVKVTVTIGSNSPEMRVTDTDGSYEVTLVQPLNPVATTGDMVSVVVTDDAGTARGREEFPLVNDILEDVLDGMSVVVNVTTDIVVPPRSVSVLEVMGMVYKEDGSTSAGGGLDVVVTRGSMTQTVQTGTDGSYSASFVELLSSVATSIDNSLSVVVSDGSRERGRNDDPLLNTELGTTGSASVTRDVISDIGLTSNVLAVLGTVYLKNGDTEHVPARSHLREGDLTVTVTNTTRNLPRSIPVEDDGTYDTTFFDPIAAVAETGDVLTVDVMNDAGESVGSVTHTLTIENLQTARVDINIMSDTPAEVRVFAIEGTVVNLDGSAAEPGLAVMIRLDMHGMVVEVTATTDAAGGYYYDFVDLAMPVAATGDVLMIDVLRAADQFHGHAVVELRSYQLVYLNQPLVIDPITLIPPTLRLGGLSINTSYADEYYGYLSLEAIKKNPELLQLIPSGILHLDLSQNLLASLPSGFNPTPEPTTDITQMFDIDSENFGNGITPRPAWHVLAGSSPPDSGRWLNGNQLSLYVVTGPIPSVQSVTFTLTGPQDGTMEAMPVLADGYMHNFQLEEERAILFLPSWPSLNANTPIFSGVTLMIDGQAPISMTSKLVGDEVVWEAPAALTADSTVYYYYQVELAEPYELGDTIVSSWPMPDPRNLQVQNRGIIETLLAPDVPELKEIVTTTDLKLRSVFNVPATGEYESLWVATFDFPAGADGAYSVDTVVQYDGGLVRNIPNQMFTLDRTPPTADIMVAIGESAGLYEGPDGYVTAVHTDEGTLNLTAMRMAAPLESEAYLYQIIQLDDAGNPGNHGIQRW